MADTFKGIITADGKKRQLPYNAVFGTPVSDKTLSEDGGFADAKVTGDNFAKAKAETDSLKGDLTNFNSWHINGDIAYGKFPKDLVKVSETTITTIKSVTSKDEYGSATFEGDKITFKVAPEHEGTFYIMFGESFRLTENDYAYLVYNDRIPYNEVGYIAMLDKKGEMINSTGQYIPSNSEFWRIINSNDVDIYGIRLDIPVKGYNQTVTFYIGKGNETTVPLYEPMYTPTILTNNEFWKGKKIITYGDSQTGQNKWQPYVEKFLGVTTQNEGHGGYPVALAVNDQLGFCLSSDFLLDDLSTKISSADVITIMGGTNDFNYDENINNENNIKIGENTDTSNNTFKGALNKIIKKIINTNQNILVVLMSPVGGLTKKEGENINSPLTNKNGYTLYDFARATKEVAEYNGIPFIDVYSCGITIYNSKEYIVDGVHMNDSSGAKRVASTVINGLKTFEQLF